MSVIEEMRRYSAVIGRESDEHDSLLSSVQIAMMVCASAGSVVTVVYLFVQNGLKWGVVLNDPATQFGLPVYAGLFTYASVVALVVAAAVCLFARSVGRLDKGDTVILGLAGALSGLLALDDLFLLHEQVLRNAFGVSELAVFAVYGAIGAAIVWRIGPAVVGARFAGLWLAVGFLAAMTVADKAEKVLGTPAWLLLAEETAKLCGFVLWAAFWIAYSRAALRND